MTEVNRRKLTGMHVRKTVDEREPLPCQGRSRPLCTAHSQNSRSECESWSMLDRSAREDGVCGPLSTSLALFEVTLYVAVRSANERFLGKDASSRSERPRNWHASTERFDWRSPIETEFSFRSVQLQNSCFGFLRWHRGGRIRDQGLNGSHTPSSIALRASLAAPFSPTVQRWKARTRRGEDR